MRFEGQELWENAGMEAVIELCTCNLPIHIGRVGVA